MNTVETKSASLEADSQKNRSIANAWPRLLWLAILVFASLIVSVLLSCATPFEAIGAAAAVTLARRDALLASGLTWLINQCVGYGMLGYPWTYNSVAWGLALGAATLVATLAAGALYQTRKALPSLLRSTLAFAAAFLAFEVAIYAVAFFFLGGLQDFTTGIVSRVLVINAATFVGLIVIHSLVAQKRVSAG
jgi:flagellar biosynthesis protein FliQ